MGYDLNRLQYIILNIMRKKNATTPMHSMSCNEIMEIEGCNQVTTIYKHIRILESYGLVKRGAKVERALGYILTEAALKLLPSDEAMEEKLND